MNQKSMALLSGLLFGLGLGFSQMIDRQRVLGFLDLAGTWDPTLLFVLGGGVAVTAISFRFVLRQSHPLFADRFQLPTKRDIDAPLIAGAAIFGIGWGISGYCPGPGVVGLVLWSWQPLVYLVALIAGMAVYQVYQAVKVSYSQGASRTVPNSKKR
ncbi:MAG: YeeE/YedE family protein [Cyanobacteria bacterium P01_H01_bin.15]